MFYRVPVLRWVESDGQRREVVRAIQLLVGRRPKHERHFGTCCQTIAESPVSLLPAISRCTRVHLKNKWQYREVPNREKLADKVHKFLVEFVSRACRQHRKSCPIDRCDQCRRKEDEEESIRPWCNRLTKCQLSHRNVPSWWKLRARATNWKSKHTNRSKIDDLSAIPCGNITSVKTSARHTSQTEVEDLEQTNISTNHTPLPSIRLRNDDPTKSLRQQLNRVALLLTVCVSFSPWRRKKHRLSTQATTIEHSSTKQIEAKRSEANENEESKTDHWLLNLNFYWFRCSSVLNPCWEKKEKVCPDQSGEVSCSYSVNDAGCMNKFQSTQKRINQEFDVILGKRFASFYHFAQIIIDEVQDKISSKERKQAKNKTCSLPELQTYNVCNSSTLFSGVKTLNNCTT